MKPRTHTIFAISPNKKRVMIGRVDLTHRTAIFDITEGRHFKEANAIGIDRSVFRRKGVQWCTKIIFNLWNGEIYRITKRDFQKHAWLYPPGPKPEYKAHYSLFKPKWMLTLDKVRELAEINAKEEEIEILRAALI